MAEKIQYLSTESSIFHYKVFLSSTLHWLYSREWTSKVGLMAAVNDMGVVFLPSRKHFFISVFITNSTENPQTNEKIIADITKAAWDYFTTTKE
ncbi:MAG: hypothetical protein U5L45_01840 [Saprospiraceae bacterium]|nr:hypothetical protein [Saprospiraceae bacterium]